MAESQNENMGFKRGGETFKDTPQEWFEIIKIMNPATGRYQK